MQEIFFLVLVRAAAFLVTCPVFSIRNVPVMTKVGLAFTLALLVFPGLDYPDQPLPGGLPGYLLAAGGEAAVGLALGTIASFIFHSIRMAGHIMDYQIGFAISGIFDPVSGSQNTILAQFFYLFGLVLYLSVDGHHGLILALARSYQVVPFAAAAVKSTTTILVIKVFAEMFALALQIAAPLLAVLVITDLAFSFVARTVPQLNVFMVGFPLKIIVGILVLSFITPLLGSFLVEVFKMIEKDVLVLMKGLT